jgi:hypothetical protein
MSDYGNDPVILGAHQPVPGGPGVLPARSQLARNIWRPSRVAPPDVVTIYNGADDRLLRLQAMIRRDDLPYVYAPPPRERTTAHAAYSACLGGRISPRWLMLPLTKWLTKISAPSLNRPPLPRDSASLRPSEGCPAGCALQQA